MAGGIAAHAVELSLNAPASQCLAHMAVLDDRSARLTRFRIGFSLCPYAVLPTHEHVAIEERDVVWAGGLGARGARKRAECEPRGDAGADVNML